jgi:hypothetical protein
VDTYAADKAAENASAPPANPDAAEGPSGADSGV